MTTRLYLDHAATTPVLPEAREAMARGFDAWANPNSPHADGRSARALLEEARKTIADALGWRHDVIFTSGASEAVEIAAARAKLPSRAHGATEHPIVRHAMGPDSLVIAVQPSGLIDEQALDSVLADGPALVEETVGGWKASGHTLTKDGKGAVTIAVVADAGGAAAPTIAALGRLKPKLADADLVLALGGMGTTKTDSTATAGP